MTKKFPIIVERPLPTYSQKIEWNEDDPMPIVVSLTGGVVTIREEPKVGRGSGSKIEMTKDRAEQVATAMQNLLDAQEEPEPEQLEEIAAYEDDRRRTAENLGGII